jgi:hypothetical protein
MRATLLVTVLAIGAGLTGCARNDPPRRDEPAARQVGREAYQAGEAIKKGAKEAAQEIREAGKELRQGYNDAKREDKSRRK